MNQPKSPPLSTTEGSSLPPLLLATAIKFSPALTRFLSLTILFQDRNVSEGDASGFTLTSMCLACISSCFLLCASITSSSNKSISTKYGLASCLRYPESSFVNAATVSIPRASASLTLTLNLTNSSMYSFSASIVITLSLLFLL